MSNLKVYRFLMCLSILIVLILFAVIMVSVIPVKVLDFKDAKYPVSEKVVKAGTYVEFNVNLIKYKDAPGTVTRQLMNSFIYNYSTVTGQIGKGEIDKLVRIEIPEYLEPGTYFLRSIYEYKTSILRTERYTHDTETFEIIK